MDRERFRRVEQTVYDATARVRGVVTAPAQCDVDIIRDYNDEWRRLMPVSLQPVGRVICDRPADAFIEANHA